MRQTTGAWWRGLLAATLLLHAQPLPLSANGDPPSFVRVSKREISGKTGRVVKSVDVFQDGVASLKDGADKTLATARLPRAEVATFHQLLADPTVLTGVPECGPPMGADLPSAELIVQQSMRTVTVKVERHCRLPAPLGRLMTLLDDVERKHLSRR